MKITYLNPFNDGTGYANAGIRTMLAMDNAGLNVVPVEFKMANQVVPAPFRIQQLASQDPTNPDVVIQHFLPNGFVYRGGAKNIGFFHVETNHFLPSMWQHHLNLMDEIWVTCEENREACEDSGITKPIKVIPLGHDLSVYNEQLEPLDLPDNRHYTFYTISDWSSRKNVMDVIRSYFLAFTRRDNVRLVLKCYVDGHSSGDSEKIIRQEIQNLKQSLRLYPNNQYPPVYLITQYLSDDEIQRLHQTGDCFVSAEQGAAWNLAAFDAMGYGNYVIVNGWGGQNQFVKGVHTNQTRYEMTPVEGMIHCPYKNMYTGYENWARPNIHDIISGMRQALSIGKYDKEKVRLSRREHMTKYAMENVGQVIQDMLECI